MIYPAMDNHLPIFPNETPEPMKPWLHVTLAHRLDGQVGIRRALSGRTNEELQVMTAGIVDHSRTLPHILMTLGLPAIAPENEFWQGQVLPLLRSEIERRARPKPPKGIGPIARLKTLDIVDVASRFTVLTGSGDRFKGKCPLHQENTASFYVYQEAGRWRCYGACATGGDVVDLVQRLRTFGRTA